MVASFESPGRKAFETQLQLLAEATERRVGSNEKMSQPLAQFLLAKKTALELPGNPADFPSRDLSSMQVIGFDVLSANQMFFNAANIAKIKQVAEKLNLHVSKNDNHKKLYHKIAISHCLAKKILTKPQEEKGLTASAPASEKTLKKAKKVKKISGNGYSPVKVITAIAFFALLATSGHWLYQRSSYGSHVGCYGHYEGKGGFGDEFFCKTESAGWGVAHKVLKPGDWRSLDYFPDEFRNNKEFVKEAIDRVGPRAFDFAWREAKNELEPYAKERMIRSFSEGASFDQLQFCPSAWYRDRTFMEKAIDQAGWGAIRFVDQKLLEIEDFHTYAQNKMITAMTADNVDQILRNCPTGWRYQDHFMKAAVDRGGWRKINFAKYSSDDLTQYAQNKMLETVNKGESLFIFDECPSQWRQDEGFMKKAIDRMGWKAITWAHVRAGSLTQYAQERMLQEIHKDDMTALHDCPNQWKHNSAFMKKAIDKAGWEAIRFASSEALEGDLTQYAQDKMFEELGTNKTLPDGCPPLWMHDKLFMEKVTSQLGELEAAKFITRASSALRKFTGRWVSSMGKFHSHSTGSTGSESNIGPAMVGT